MRSLDCEYELVDQRRCAHASILRPDYHPVTDEQQKKTCKLNKLNSEEKAAELVQAAFLCMTIN